MPEKVEHVSEGCWIAIKEELPIMWLKGPRESVAKIRGAPDQSAAAG
eukprot:CAMPEP_0180653936 /NCGR_PEP_ID=MMETSP1037_2-20121125/54393_1 /TAXON_ID=632150 /ORGANISM="Azadinium spinosum, Strain 3D9" /LENGTH=46 /DNA_ID= /DNA_START= /DNA_END= /DNA_ORIENTATION=